MLTVCMCVHIHALLPLHMFTCRMQWQRRHFFKHTYSEVKLLWCEVKLYDSTSVILTDTLVLYPSDDKFSWQTLLANKGGERKEGWTSPVYQKLKVCVCVCVWMCRPSLRPSVSQTSQFSSPGPSQPAKRELCQEKKDFKAKKIPFLFQSAIQPPSALTGTGVFRQLPAIFYHLSLVCVSVHNPLRCGD